MPDQEADEFVVSDPELITRVRAGDREAFGELYKRHSGAATTLSRQFARSATESDDLVSESFARVLDNLLAGKGPDTAFRAYLFTTIRNTAYDRTRKDKRLQFTDDMTTHDVAVVGVDPVLAKMESGLIAAAFAQLPERWQAVLWHTQVEGESPAQVGALLGMAPGAVSSLAFRAREGLREAYLQAHLAETAAEQCRTTVDRLGAWTRGGLSKREKGQVDAHLETCDRCRALAAELDEVNHGLRGLLAPMLLGGAAVGYLATLGPVAPLAAPGTLIVGAASTGAGSAGSGVAGGSSSGAGGAAGAAGGTAGSAAATAAGVAAAAAAAGAIGLTAWAAAGSSGGATVAAAGPTAAGATGAGGAGGAVGATGAGGVAGAGTVGAAGAAGSGGAGGGAGAAAGAGTASAGGTGAGGASAGGTGAGGAGGGAAAGAGGVFAGLGVGGLVAAGAALVLAAVVAVVFIVNGNSPDTINTAGQDAPGQNAAGGGQAQNSSADPAAGDVPGAGGIFIADPAATGTAGTAASVPVVPGGDPGSAGGTDGAVVPVVDTGTQPTEPAAGQTNGPATRPVMTPTATQPNAPGDPATTQPETSTATPPIASPPTTTPPPLAADLLVSGLTAQPLNAGGTADVTMTVANNGGGASAVESMSVDLPLGVQVTNVTVGDPLPAMRRVNAGLLRAGPCVTQTPTNCTINLPALAALMKLPVRLTLSAETTAEGGPMRVTVLGKSVTFMLTVNSPAALELGNLAVSGDLYSGGTGQLTVPVANNGQQNSVDQRIRVDGLPDGVTVSGIRGDGVSCGTDQGANALAAGAPSCALLPIEPDNTRTLLIDLDVQPSAQTQTEAATTVTIGDSLTSASLPLTVLPGITTLRTKPSGPFTAGQPATVTVTPELQGTATTAGPVTVTSTDKTVTFGPSTGCSPGPESNAVTCTTSPFDLDINIPEEHEAGPLLTATDAGDRPLKFNPDPQIQAATPAKLTLGTLTENQKLTAGGTGQLRIDITNTGQRKSTDQAITLTGLPDGVTLTGITAGDTPLCTAPQPQVAFLAAGAPFCTLPPIDPDKTLTLMIDLDVQPLAHTQTDGATTITIGDNLTSASLPLTVLPGITTLRTEPSGPFTAGQPAALTVTPELQGTATTAGPVTVTSTDKTVTFGPSTGCSAVPETNAVTCTTSPFDLDIVIPVDHEAGQLLLTATDEGGRELPTVTIEIAAAAPANLEVAGLAISQPLVAGGTGQLTLTVTNTGALLSTEQAIDVLLPPGKTGAIAVTGITVGEFPLCTAGEPTVSCILPPVDAGNSRTLVIGLTVSATIVREPGDAIVTIGDGPKNSVSTPLAVTSGITGLIAQQPGPFTAGTTAPLTLTPELLKGLTDAGKVTLTAQASVTFGESKACTPSAGGSEITCDGSVFTVQVKIPADQKAGLLPVTAKDAGGRPVLLRNADGNPLQVGAAPVHLAIDGLKVSQGTGFGGSIDLTVSNPGTQASGPMLIDVSLPKGFTPGFILRQVGLGLDFGSCTATQCPLLPIKAGGSVSLTIYFTANSSAISGPGKITIDGDVASFSVTGRGRINLDLLKADDATAPDPAAGSDLDLAFGIPPKSKATAPADTQDPSTEPPTTLAPAADPVTSGGTSHSTPADPGTGEASPTTDGSPVPTTKSPGSAAPVSPDDSSTNAPMAENSTTASPVPASPTPAAPAPETSPAGSGPPVNNSTAGIEAGIDEPTREPISPPVPAALTLTEPAGDGTVIAGGTGALTFTAGNSGGERSAPTALNVSLPAGVSVTSVSVNGTTICGSESCRLPGISPGESVNVVVAIAAAPGAEPGGAQATISGGGVGWMVDVEPAAVPEPSVIPPARIPDAVIPDAVIPAFGDQSPASN